MELSPQQLSKIQRLAKILDDGEVAIAHELEQLDEKIDKVDTKVTKEIDSLKEQVSTVEKMEGKAGHTPVKGVDYEDGHDYVLTEIDKKEIADSITVPVVTKVIEKTEVIREIPVVRETIKETIKEPVITNTTINQEMTGEKIVQVLNDLEIKPELQIDAKHIKNLPVQGNVPAYGGARTLAGLLDVSVTGVTTNQSIKWNGTRWVAYTPSTGGFQIPVSGAVNGTNQTYVWTTAPNVISVDNGRIMQKVSSDGTVNWTGTTTTVLTIAPNWDIFAIA